MQSHGQLLSSGSGTEKLAQLHRSSKPRSMFSAMWPWLTVVALVVVVWAPRLSGPIDLRWDAGVYYVLGTSLVREHAYRVASEPGLPEALQYPPLLPAIVAGHELLLGTSDWHVVAPWLRVTNALMFLAYGLAVFAVGRRYLGRSFGLLATALCLFQITTIFLSDALFTELPFALVSVLLVLVVGKPDGKSNNWGRETLSLALAAAGFLLRSVGLGLLAAWVLEASVRKRWMLAGVRAALALLPLLAWYGYVLHVRGSYEYRHPAYAYQRAPYLFYNVSYSENALLADPAHPERGRATASELASRILRNVPPFLLANGETVSTVRFYWEKILWGVQRAVKVRLLPPKAALLPIVLLTANVFAGLVILLRRGVFLIPLVVAVSGALICTTPWPLQFQRYMTPLAPFLAIAAVLALVQFRMQLREHSFARSFGVLGHAIVAAFVLLTLGSEIVAASQIFYYRQKDGAEFGNTGSSAKPRFFFHDQDWVSLERAFAWIDKHAPPDAIVATPSSHLCYLLTGRRAVSPPVEPNAEKARLMLQAVPVLYVVVDELGFTDVSRRYARPAVESDPADWRLGFSVTNGTKVYQRVEQTR
jgi:hypothetical protein